MTGLKQRPITRDEAIVFCRRNYGKLSGSQIEVYLANRGFPASNALVRRFANPDKYDAARVRRSAKLREQRLYKRMTDLRDAGLSCSAIGRVLKVDFGINVGEETVRQAFRDGRPTKKMLREYSERLL